jgi:hypothetical protein
MLETTIRQMPAAFKSHLIVPPNGMNSGSFQVEICKQESARRHEAIVPALTDASGRRRAGAVVVDMGVRLVEILVEPRQGSATKGMRRRPQEGG